MKVREAYPRTRWSNTYSGAGAGMASRWNWAACSHDGGPRAGAFCAHEGAWRGEEGGIILRMLGEAVDAELAFQYGHDPGTVATWWTAYMLWETGAFDQVLAVAERGLAIARRIGHPYSLASALFWAVDLGYFIWLAERMRQPADEAIAAVHCQGCQRPVPACNVVRIKS